MAYNIGSQTSHRTFLFDCNMINTTERVLPSTAYDGSNALVDKFTFKLFQDAYFSKVLVKKVVFPYTFYNGNLAGVVNVKMKFESFDTQAAEVITAEVTMQEVNVYQLTQQNLIDMFNALVAKANNEWGADAAPGVEGDYELFFEADDQQMGFRVLTPMQIPTGLGGVQDLPYLHISMVVEISMLTHSRESARNVYFGTYGAMFQGDEYALSEATVGGVPVWRFSELLMSISDPELNTVNDVTFKPTIFNFLNPPYVLLHCDFMKHSLVKPAVLPFYVNSVSGMENSSVYADGNGGRSMRKDTEATTVASVVYLTSLGSLGSNAPGSCYLQVEDGNLENYKLLQPNTIKEVNIWFTLADGVTKIGFGQSRPIVEVYAMD